MIFLGQGAVADLSKVQLGVPLENRFEVNTAQFMADLENDPKYRAVNGKQPRFKRDEFGQVACTGLGAQNYLTTMQDHKPYESQARMRKRYLCNKDERFTWGEHRFHGVIYHWSSPISDDQVIYTGADALVPVNLLWVYAQHFFLLPRSDDLARSVRKILLRLASTAAIQESVELSTNRPLGKVSEGSHELMVLGSPPEAKEDADEPMEEDQPVVTPTRAKQIPTEFPTSKSLDGGSAGGFELLEVEMEDGIWEHGEDLFNLVDQLLYPAGGEEEQGEPPAATNAGRKPEPPAAGSSELPVISIAEILEPPAATSARISEPPAASIAGDPFIRRPPAASTVENSFPREPTEPPAASIVGDPFIRGPPAAMNAANPFLTEPPTAQSSDGLAATTRSGAESRAAWRRRPIEVRTITDDRLRHWAERRGFSDVPLRRLQQVKRDRFSGKVRMSAAAKERKKMKKRLKRKEKRIQAAMANAARRGTVGSTVETDDPELPKN